MKGYSEVAVFSASYVRTFDEVARRVQAVNGFDYAANVEIRCHELARACARIATDLQLMPLDVVDGKYGPVDHSWCVFRADYRHVLDVYCVGRLPMVQLVTLAGVLGVHRKAYLPGPPRTDIQKHTVDHILREMKGIE